MPLALFRLVLAATIVLPAGSSAPDREPLRIAAGSVHGSLWRRVYRELPAAWKSNRRLCVQEVSDSEMDRLVAKNEEDEREAARQNQNGDDHFDPDARDDEGRDTDQHGNEDLVVDGVYQEGGDDDREPPTITLREAMDDSESMLVFAHEYGHFVWNVLMTDTQRNRYTRCWRTQKRADRLVTEYARDSDEEGFAETFAWFIRKPEALRRADGNGSQFLRDLLAEMQAKERPVRL